MIKAGWKTTEFWLNVGNAIIGLLVIYGIVNSDEAQAWQVLIVAIIPLALSIASGYYSYSRALVKSQQIVTLEVTDE